MKSPILEYVLALSQYFCSSILRAWPSGDGSYTKGSEQNYLVFPALFAEDLTAGSLLEDGPTPVITSQRLQLNGSSFSTFPIISPPTLQLDHRSRVAWIKLAVFCNIHASSPLTGSDQNWKSHYLYCFPVGGSQSCQLQPPLSSSSALDLNKDIMRILINQNNLNFFFMRRLFSIFCLTVITDFPYVSNGLSQVS